MSAAPDPWSDGDAAPAVPLAEHLPVEFSAFVFQHQQAYLRYAHLHLGSKEEAIEVVEGVFARLARNWDQVLRQASVEAYALAELKESLARRLVLAGRPPAIAETAAFTAAREAARHRLHTLESALGLYSAIARLPERQLDVILLAFVIGCPLSRVAHMMGVCEGTVRSHLHAARRRLSQELNLEERERV